ncbi:MAG: MoxR family ATPase [Verrucomicrobiota bacterium]|nr:MoxR family ATPase [Verrucomicrobiota bacterium]MEC9326480.1 MoxR family ATPase [Verrucomicrobiota bacterium]MED6299089.1 MoxR family ATPase [Verrucomicrobiota bacterium]MEE2966478.1 MoxR family ATPase [Verrucomicrobiota bacterium]
MSVDTIEITAQVEKNGNWINPLREEMARVLIGQHSLVDSLIIGLLTKGHLLIEGVPGLAKTLTINALAGCLNVGFKRIQFTPDLLPADVIGTLIYSPQNGTFSPRLGPVFTNLLLADEINRAPAKVQSALLEAMQERQVTIGDTSYELPDPFLVMATQNPLDQEGTYQLPEAQLDRFLLKVTIDYPNPEEERSILELMGNSNVNLSTNQILSKEQIAESRKVADSIYVDESIKDYIVSLVISTREPEKIDGNLLPYIRCGASPRATINLTLASKANAFIQGRGYVTPTDVKKVAPEILRHRVLLTYEAEAEQITTDQLVSQILEGVPVP